MENGTNIIAEIHPVNEPRHRWSHDNESIVKIRSEELTGDCHPGWLVALDQIQVHAFPRLMDGVPTFEVLGAPCRDVSFRRVTFPVILDVGVGIHHANIAATIDQEIQQIDAGGFPHVFDTIAYDNEIEPDPWRGQEIDGVTHDDLVIDGFEFELLNVGLVDLYGIQLRDELMIRHALSDQVPVLPGSWPNVEGGGGAK